MYVIAGLGNPERRYENTRHNVGFDVIGALAGQYNINMNIKKHKAICGMGIGGSKDNAGEAADIYEFKR